MNILYKEDLNKETGNDSNVDNFVDNLSLFDKLRLVNLGVINVDGSYTEAYKGLEAY